MSAGTSKFFCLIYLLVCSCAAEEITTAKVGQNATLPCKVPNDKKLITAVEWIRPGLKPDTVLYYSGGHFNQDIQHPSYTIRTALQDEAMKDGDFSLILKNVTMEDTGRYQCRVFAGKNNELINIINLEVQPADESLKDQPHYNLTISILAVSLAVSLAVHLAVISFAAFILCIRTRKHDSKMKTLVQEMQEELNQVQGVNEKLLETKGNLIGGKLKSMKTERKLKNKIQKMIQELDEMNFDSNSDSTGSNKKNQQEELEKLLLEKQNWMKTVGNLKTKLQEMNQELERGSIIDEVDKRLQNIPSEDVELQG